MDLKQRIKVALGLEEESNEPKEVQLMFEDKLADGTIIVSEADELAAGVLLNILSEDGVQTPLPEGNYVTESGVEFSVDADGIVLEVAEEVAEEEVEEDVEEDVELEITEEVEETEEVELNNDDSVLLEVTTVVKELLEEVKNDIGRLTAELDELRGENLAKDENLAELQEENINLTSQVQELGAEASVEPVKVSKFAKANVSTKKYEDMNVQEKYMFNFNNQK